jgi:hypothetical protein
MPRFEVTITNHSNRPVYTVSYTFREVYKHQKLTDFSFHGQDMTTGFDARN